MTMLSYYYVIELCQSSLEKLFLKDVDPQKYCGPMQSEINVLIQLSSELEFIHE
jgi:serine/threonine-protein kinase/endoribonuclease IRE1